MALKVFDNTRDADPVIGERPEPRPILHLRAGRILYLCPLDEVPLWAKPIVQSALAAAR